MINRINLILRAKNITARQFAEEIGIQPSGMSHILGGRNKPSLDFVTKVIRRYPEIDANWLLMGRGEMYTGGIPSPTPESRPAPTPAPAEAEATLFSDSVAEPSSYAPSYIAVPPEPEDDSYEDDTADDFADEPTEVYSTPAAAEPGSRLTRMLFIYSDNTFEEFVKR